MAFADSPRLPATASYGPAPRVLPLAAAMFVLYGVATVLNGIVFAGVAHSQNIGGILCTLLPMLGAGLVAWGLLYRSRWAWIGLGLALSAVGHGFLVISVFDHGDIYWLPPSNDQLFFVAGLLSAGAAVALLLTDYPRESPSVSQSDTSL